MIYGYMSKQLTSEGLLEMKEVTICGNPQVLREIASFFQSMADRIESGEIEAWSHRHISSQVSDWETRFPGRDIIITPPVAADTLQGPPHGVAATLLRPPEGRVGCG